VCLRLREKFSASGGDRTPVLQSVISHSTDGATLVPKQSNRKDVFFKTQWVFTVERYLASRSYLFVRMSKGIHLSILLCQTNRQYLVWWTVSVTQEAYWTEIVPVYLQCLSDDKDIWWIFPTLLFVFWFQYNFFLTNRACVRNGLRDFSITLYMILK
jgi:hypothetical protein